ncbi:hypothetical protein GCM10027419_09410 [Pandoraea terrae]
MLLTVALGSTVAAYHYATGLTVGGGVFERIGIPRARADTGPPSSATRLRAGAVPGCASATCAASPTTSAAEPSPR